MTPLTHLVVLDFEATCEKDAPPDPQELIEFPSVLLDARTFEVVDEFEAFVRPIHHPTLSKFCMDLTGISQDDVDGAETFIPVFESHMKWLESHGLQLHPPPGTDLPYAILTCGDWDLQKALPNQLAASGIDFVPEPYRRWVNIKHVFKRWDAQRKFRAGMAAMLQALELELVGRHHRGIDDSRNIARITEALARRGQTIEVTGHLAPSRFPTIKITLTLGERREVVELHKRALGTLLGIACAAFGRGIRRAWHEDQAIESDADLTELRSGATLRVQ